MKPTEYKEGEFIHFIREKTGEVCEVNSKNDSRRKHPKHDMYEIYFDEIESINLDSKGVNIPFARKNVINIERYMFKYWQPIIGSDAIMLYLNLWEYCDERNGVNMCYPKMSELAQKMGRSVPNIRKNLTILEENNFTIVIHRLNKLANNGETSPLFILRETVPLLSREQYKQLPPILQKKHDEYMERFAKGAELELFQSNSRRTIEELIQGGDKIISKKTREEINEIIQKQQDTEYLFANLSEEQQLNLRNESLHNAITEAGTSAPTFSMFYDKSLSLYDNGTVHMIVKDKATRDFLESSNHINESQRQIIQRALESLYGHVDKIELYVIEEYIVKVLKG